MLISKNLVHIAGFWKNLHQVCSKANNLNHSLGSRKPKDLTPKIVILELRDITLKKIM
jgi:hypothetical protein